MKTVLKLALLISAMASVNVALAYEENDYRDGRTEQLEREADQVARQQAADDREAADNRREQQREFNEELRETERRLEENR